MKCPNCGNSKTIILDVRSKKNIKKRRRECQNCGHRFNTLETTMEYGEDQVEIIRSFLELVEKYERERKQWVKLSVLQAIKHLLD